MMLVGNQRGTCDCYIVKERWKTVKANDRIQQPTYCLMKYVEKETNKWSNARASVTGKASNKHIRRVRLRLKLSTVNSPKTPTLSTGN